MSLKIYNGTKYLMYNKVLIALFYAAYNYWKEYFKNRS